jgi:putative inorganic carbon (hco3(-)) transporter
LQALTNTGLICISVLLSIAFGVSLYYNLFYLFLLPPFIAALYFAVFHTEKTFLSLGILFPLSVNIEEYTKNTGLFIPTEPILFGLLLVLCATQIKAPFLSRETWKQPIIYTWLILLAWIFITSVTSSNPLISFKFLLAKSWFVIPILFFGTYFFKNEQNISRFFVLLTIGVSVTALYTIVNHASYGFGEKESHWVMFPFFKDHTIYGAIIALSIPISIALLLVVKQKPLKQFMLLLMAVILLLGLYFSYTRAAWLSIFIAVFIGFIIHIKLNKQIVLGVGIILLLFATYKWQTIQFELSRNKQEHTTEDFSERLQSAVNVTTDASNLERINRWSCALEMFKERPVFGFGPGTYSFEYARFQSPDNLTIISTNFGNLGNAHSEYLSFLSEMGLLGLIFFLAFVFSIFYSAIKLYYQTDRKEKNKRVFIMAMIISLSSYFIHAFLNNFLDTDKAAVPVFVLCAIIVSLRMNNHVLAANPKGGIERLGT